MEKGAAGLLDQLGSFPICVRFDPRFAVLFSVSFTPKSPREALGLCGAGKPRLSFTHLPIHGTSHGRGHQNH